MWPVGKIIETAMEGTAFWCDPKVEGFTDKIDVFEVVFTLTMKTGAIFHTLLVLCYLQ